MSTKRPVVGGYFSVRLDLAVAGLMVAAGNVPVYAEHSTESVVAATGVAMLLSGLVAWARALYFYASTLGPPPYRGDAGRYYRVLVWLLAVYSALWGLAWVLGVARALWGCRPCWAASFHAGLAATVLYGLAARLAPAYALARLTRWWGHSLPVASMLAATAASALVGLAVDAALTGVCGLHCKYTRLYYGDPGLVEAIDAGLEEPWWPSWGGVVQTLLYPRLLVWTVRSLRARV